MRIVRSKSIPNVDDGRLVHDLGVMHNLIHTADGLHYWDRGHGKHLFDAGVKTRKIAAELVRRGHPAPDCRHCWNG